MANIYFLPVCSQCGNILWEEDIEFSYDLDSSFNLVKNIRPVSCKLCKESFDRVELPVKLPFKSPKSFCEKGIKNEQS